MNSQTNTITPSDSDVLSSVSFNDRFAILDTARSYCLHHSGRRQVFETVQAFMDTVEADNDVDDGLTPEIVQAVLEANGLSIDQVAAPQPVSTELEIATLQEAVRRLTQQLEIQNNRINNALNLARGRLGSSVNF